MSIKPVLTARQKERLAVLEPALRVAASRGDYRRAKDLGLELQDLLAPTGHVTRLMHSKCWVFQAAMEAGDLSVAEAGFIGIRQKVNLRTRVHLEATALLAVCYLRKKRIDLAEPLMAEVLRDDAVIKSAARRRQFRSRIVTRFEEEGLLAATVGHDLIQPDLDDLKEAVERAVQGKTDDELLAEIGAAIPQNVIDILLRIHEFSRKQLPANEQKLLAAPQQLIHRRELGKKIFCATSRLVWKSLCDPTGPVQTAWQGGNLPAVWDNKLLIAEVASALGGMRIGLYALVVSTVALVVKQGLDKVCVDWTPDGVMIPIGEK